MLFLQVTGAGKFHGPAYQYTSVLCYGCYPVYTTLSVFILGICAQSAKGYTLVSSPN